MKKCNYIFMIEVLVNRSLLLIWFFVWNLAFCYPLAFVLPRLGTNRFLESMLKQRFVAGIQTAKRW